MNTEEERDPMRDDGLVQIFMRRDVLQLNYRRYKIHYLFEGEKRVSFEN